MSDEFIDSGWSLANDLLSVTVGINTRLWILRQQNKIPTLIRLGKLHSKLFWKERGRNYIPNKPLTTKSNDVVYDEDLKCWCYKSQTNIPIRFNDPLIYGIAVEGVPKPPKEKKTRTGKKKST